MKTRNLFLLAGLALTLSTQVYAKTDNDPSANLSFNAALQVTQDDAVIFRCENNVYQKLNVKIYDASNTLLHSKYVTTKGNIKLTYNLADLPDGTFTIKVFNKTKLVYSQDFTKDHDEDYFITLD